MKEGNTLSLYEFDEAYRKDGLFLAGVDEAGRGPLAGPVCVAAVILDPQNPIQGLNDSKKLTEKKREELFPEICEKAVAYSVVFASHLTIDRKNILAATLSAMADAIRGLKVKPNLVLIDGNQLPKDTLEMPMKAVIGGDHLSATIAAASILAKVSRDRYMTQMDEEYLGYGFAKHKGYGTEAHYDALRKLGPSTIHRKSFLKNFDPTKPTRQEVGRWGEQYVANVLEEQGFSILERNYSVPKGEIDIIAQKDGDLFVGEVKCYRKGNSYKPRAAVTVSKQKKIIAATAEYLQGHPLSGKIQFDVFEIVVDDTNGLCADSFVWIPHAFEMSPKEGVE